MTLPVNRPLPLNGSNAVFPPCCHDDLDRVLITQEEIARRVTELAAEISHDYEGKNIALLGVLRGAFVFIADLIRHLSVSYSVDFLAVESYYTGTVSTGEVRMTKDLDESVAGRHVLVVEDIIDSGLTLHYLLDLLEARHPASLCVCTLLNKPNRRQVEIPVQYTGFSISDEFVVGYGLDYNQKYRGLPCIGILRPEIYGSS